MIEQCGKELEKMSYNAYETKDEFDDVSFYHAVNGLIFHAQFFGGIK